MSNVDDLRKLFQDLLTPELRALTARLDGFEKLTEERFRRLEETMASNHREVMNALNLDKRMALIEDRQQREATHG